MFTGSKKEAHIVEAFEYLCVAPQIPQTLSAFALHLNPSNSLRLCPAAVYKISSKPAPRPPKSNPAQLQQHPAKNFPATFNHSPQHSTFNHSPQHSTFNHILQHSTRTAVICSAFQVQRVAE
jgi:hypothetical protein